MKKISLILCLIGATLMLVPLAGCGPSSYSTGYGDSSYGNDPWRNDRYYRTRVYRHHYRPVSSPRRMR